MSAEDGGKSVVPWKEVGKVVAGVAAVSGIGYVAYRLVASSSSSNDDPSVSKPSSSSTEAKQEPQKPVTPLGQALKHKEAGNRLFKAGNYTEAIDEYTRAIEACPDGKPLDKAAFYQNRAAAQERLDRTEEVVRDCSEAIGCNREYTKAYNRRARAYERLVDFKSALYDFTACCILEQFRNYSTMENADRVLKSLSEVQAKEMMKVKAGKPLNLSTTFVESYLFSFTRDPVVSSSSTLNVKAKNGTTTNGGGQRDNNADDADGDGLSGIALVRHLIQNRDYNEVSAVCTTIIDKHAGGAADEKNAVDDEKELLESYLVRATFNLIRGNSVQATSDFDQVFQLVAKLPADDQYSKDVKVNAHVKRGSFFMQQGKKDECLADFDEAEKVDPTNPDIYHHRGQLRILMNQTVEGQKDFAKSIELNPDFALARMQGCYADYRAATMSGSMADVTTALVRFEQLVGDYPDCSEGFALLGQAYVERQNFADAEDMFSRALKLAPGNANIYVHRGLLILNRSEDTKTAIEMMLKALEVDPNCEFAYETLGTVESQRGNVKEAIKYYEKALGLARTELEVVHLISMKEASLAQVNVARQMGIQLPPMMG